MSKVKESITMLVGVPGYACRTPIIIDYESIWTDLYGNWKFQTWFEYCKKYINVQGRYNKDGKMSLRNICVSMSNVAETFYHYPSQCQPIWDKRITEYK